MSIEKSKKKINTLEVTLSKTTMTLHSRTPQMEQTRQSTQDVLSTTTTNNSWGSWIWWLFKMYLSMRLLFLPHLFYYGWQELKRCNREAAEEAAKWDVTIRLSADGRKRTTTKKNRETGQVISFEEFVHQTIQKKEEENTPVKLTKAPTRVVAKRVVKASKIDVQQVRQYDASRRIRTVKRYI